MLNNFTLRQKYLNNCLYLKQNYKIEELNEDCIANCLQSFVHCKETNANVFDIYHYSINEGMLFH